MPPTRRPPLRRSVGAGLLMPLRRDRRLHPHQALGLARPSSWPYWADAAGWDVVGTGVGIFILRFTKQLIYLSIMRPMVSGGPTNVLFAI